jgi:prepilin peptidase CpaA
MNFFAHFAASPAHIPLAALVIAAGVTDWRTHRLPNWLTLGGTLAGIAFNLLPQGVGLLYSILGVLTALALLLPLYVLRATGAGDVKLVAMVGAFLGLPDLLFALPFMLVAGGLLALGYALFHRSVGRLAANTRDLTQLTAIAVLHGQRPSLGGITSIGKLPYGVCVCVGTLAWLAWRHLHG